MRFVFTKAFVQVCMKNFQSTFLFITGNFFFFRQIKEMFGSPHRTVTEGTLHVVAIASIRRLFRIMRTHHDNADPANDQTHAVGEFVSYSFFFVCLFILSFTSLFISFLQTKFKKPTLQMVVITSADFAFF